jgi:hypothetical protein
MTILFLFLAIGGLAAWREAFQPQAQSSSGALASARQASAGRAAPQALAAHYAERHARIYERTFGPQAPRQEPGPLRREQAGYLRLGDAV